MKTSVISQPEIRRKAEQAREELLEKNFSFNMRWHAITNLESWYMSKLTAASNERFTNFFDNILPSKLTRMYAETNTT